MEKYYGKRVSKFNELFVKDIIAYYPCDLYFGVDLDGNIVDTVGFSNPKPESNNFVAFLELKENSGVCLRLMRSEKEAFEAASLAAGKQIVGLHKFL